MTPADDLFVKFTDALGVEWTAWEDIDRGEAVGALVFDSREERRRLPAAPPSWWDLEPGELAQLCARAAIE